MKAGRENIYTLYGFLFLLADFPFLEAINDNISSKSIPVDKRPSLVCLLIRMFHVYYLIYIYFYFVFWFLNVFSSFWISFLFYYFPFVISIYFLFVCELVWSYFTVCVTLNCTQLYAWCYKNKVWLLDWLIIITKKKKEKYSNREKEGRDHHKIQF